MKIDTEEQKKLLLMDCKKGGLSHTAIKELCVALYHSDANGCPHFHYLPDGIEAHIEAVLTFAAQSYCSQAFEQVHWNFSQQLTDSPSARNFLPFKHREDFDAQLEVSENE